MAVTKIFDLEEDLEFILLTDVANGINNLPQEDALDSRGTTDPGFHTLPATATGTRSGWSVTCWGSLS